MGFCLILLYKQTGLWLWFGFFFFPINKFVNVLPENGAQFLLAVSERRLFGSAAQYMASLHRLEFHPTLDFKITSFLRK